MRISGKPILRLLGNTLIGLGLLLMVGVGGGYAYSLYMEQQVRSDPWLSQAQAAWEETATPSTVQAEATAGPVVTATPMIGIAPARPALTPTPTPRTYAPAVGMRIPSIGVDSRVVEVGLVNGEYEVPRFYVGHYTGTSAPGEPGNGVYTGHVESLDKGQVFARLSSVKIGEEIQIYSADGVWRYRITEIKIVPYDDLSVMQPTPDTRVTLITCTGTYDWATRQYTHRFIVTAKLVTPVVPEKMGAR
ncbi:MAG: sortase [Chloroflexota bacterium]